MSAANIVEVPVSTAPVLVNLKVCKLLQFWKAALSMQFSLPQIGITMLFNFSQPLKANSEIVSIGYGNSIVSLIPSEVQPSNK